MARNQNLAMAVYGVLELLFDIADALEVDPADLISASMIPDKMLKGRESLNTAE